MVTGSITKNKKIILLIGDISILYFSLWLTLFFRYYQSFNLELWWRHFWLFSVVFLVWLLLFYIDNLYDVSQRIGNSTLLVRVLRSSLISTLVASALFYFGQNRLFTLRPQIILLIVLLLAIILTFLWRVILYRWIASPKRANGLMIIGYSKGVEEIIETIDKNPQIGLQLKSILLPNHIDLPHDLAAKAEVNGFTKIKELCVSKNITTIVTTIHPRQNSDLLNNLFECLPLQINVYHIANFYEKVTGKIPVSTIEQAWFLENINENFNKNFYERAKRVTDILVSVALLIASLPLTLATALAIKFTSKGPIFFSQVRLGEGGKEIKILKFRTMVVNAEMDGPRWAVKNDLRITKIGKFLRKTRIDEIPQLLNVIKNEMSFIGPRPERPEFVEELQQKIPFYKERLLIKPGLTGWAQVAGPAYGGSVEESLEKLQYDLYYLKNRSFSLDLSIYLKTINTVITRKGQ